MHICTKLCFNLLLQPTFQRIDGSTTLNGPARSWQTLRTDIVGDEVAARSPAAAATLGLVDMMGPITQANDADFPRNLDDITPNWPSVGVGAPPLRYRSHPSSACAVTASFVQIMQILVNRHLLIPGETTHSPRKMCAYLLGLASDQHALQNIGGRGGNVGEYWPLHYQWNLGNADVDTKRRAMRALFVSLNMVIQQYYPDRIVNTVGDSTLEYG